MKRKLLYVVLLLAIGVALAEWCQDEVVYKNGYFHKDQIQTFLTDSAEWMESFVPIVFARGKTFAAIVLLSFTPLVKYLGKLLWTVVLAGFGFLLWIFFLCFGWKGILAVFATVFPHGIIYAGTIVIVLYLRSMGRYGKGNGSSRKRILRIAGWILAVLLFLLGTVTESTVGAVILKYALSYVI